MGPPQGGGVGKANPIWAGTGPPAEGVLLGKSLCLVQITLAKLEARTSKLCSEEHLPDCSVAPVSSRLENDPDLLLRLRNRAASIDRASLSTAFTSTYKRKEAAMQLPHRGMQLQNMSCTLSQPGATAVQCRVSSRRAMQHACPAPPSRHQEQKLRPAVWQAARSRVARAAGVLLLCGSTPRRQDREGSEHGGCTSSCCLISYAFASG